MALKRKGLTVFEDEEQVSKRRLRSSRTIETSTSPLRLAKVVSASADSRVKNIPATRTVMKIARVVDIGDEFKGHNKIYKTPLQQSQAVGIVRHKVGQVARSEEITMGSSNSLQFPEKSPTKTTMEVTIYTPRKKSRRLTTAPSECTNISSSPLRIHGLGSSLPEAIAVGSSKTTVNTLYQSSSQNSNFLPSHLHPCFNAQKQAILRRLQRPSAMVDECDNLSAANEIAARQLADLIEGTVIRGEGNSCIVLGPRGSGKSRLVERCIDDLKAKPIVLRLSGWLQSTDRHALREIGFQLLQQTGVSMLENSENMLSNARDERVIEDDENPFPEASNMQIKPPASSISLPPSSHLHTLIPILSTLGRPVIVILDAFDLFALHPRQSLLYCLLDTVQNCRASSRNRGIAVIGITNRVDTIQLLEKRVKSRFSGRTIRTGPPNTLVRWIQLARDILHTPVLGGSDDFEDDWKQRWTANVDKLLADKAFPNVLNETFSITRDVRILVRILTTAVLQLNPSAPYLSLRVILASVDAQRARPRYPHLMNISYPSMCLLIASLHADTAGHSTFTFEMLFNNFQDQARASTSAPVQINGGSIGMVRCKRQILMSAFEDLVAANIFIAVVASSFNIAKEFVKHRCAIEREFIKGAVEKSGQVNLKKWLNKAQ